VINWTFKEKEAEPPVGAVAFVYYLEITDKLGKLWKYIGKKQLTSARRTKVTGSARRKIVITESNWKKYLSSSLHVKAMLKDGGKLTKREILMWCNSKTCATFHELKEQVMRNVLCDPEYLNKCIAVRLLRCGN